MLNGICRIIGTGHAASQLAAGLRREGWEGQIHMIGQESVIPYQKPPLSKAFLANDKKLSDILIFNQSFYEKKNIELSLETQVKSIDRTSQTIHLNNDSILAYDKLAICTGASPRKLTIENHHLKHIYYLNAYEDALQIKSRIQHCKQVVIIGGGFIGLELAAKLAQLHVSVTVLEAQSRILNRVAAPELSEYFTQLHHQHNVNIVTDTNAIAFEGSDYINGVVCDNGKYYSADCVLVGIGAQPNIELAQACGLETNNGIVVDEYTATNDTAIVAVGDCTQYPHRLLGKTVRLESIQNANAQAKVAAAYLCGKHKAMTELPWFWSDQYDVKLQIAGFNQGYTHTVMRGKVEDNKFSLWYFHAEKLLAVDCINSPQDFMFAKKAITHNAIISTSTVQDTNKDLSEIFQAA